MSREKLDRLERLEDDISLRDFRLYKNYTSSLTTMEMYLVALLDDVRKSKAYIKDAHKAEDSLMYTHVLRDDLSLDDNPVTAIGEKLQAVSKDYECLVSNVREAQEIAYEYEVNYIREYNNTIGK